LIDINLEKIPPQEQSDIPHNLLSARFILRADIVIDSVDTTTLAEVLWKVFSMVNFIFISSLFFRRHPPALVPLK